MDNHLSLGNLIIINEREVKNQDGQQGPRITKRTQKIRCEATYEAKQEQIHFEADFTSKLKHDSVTLLWDTK